MRKLDIKAAKSRISARRNELKLSQEELGGRFGMSRAGFSAAESTNNMKNFFTPGQLVNLKYELGVSLDYLLEGIQGGEFYLGEAPEPLNKEIEYLKKQLEIQQQLIDSLKRENALLIKVTQ